MSFNAFKVIDVFCNFFSTRKAATKLNFAVLLSNTMGKQIPENMRKLIIKLSTENKSYADISKITGIPRSTVGRIVKTFKSTGRKVARPRPGRTPKVSEQSRRLLGRLSKICPHLTARQLKSDWSMGHMVSIRTVQRYLQNMNLHGRRAAQKPCLNQGQRKARLKWCRDHSKNTLQDWQKICYSDETIIDLSAKKAQFVRRPPGSFLRYNARYLAKYVPKKSAKLMMWGCIWSSGHRVLVRVRGNMDSRQYGDILEQYVAPNVQDGFLFQQDNAPCHTSQFSRKTMENLGIALLPNWPARSPDLNIIENLWKMLKDRLEGAQYQNLDQLWNFVESQFYSIPDETIANLYLSIPKRVNSVISSRGYPTKY